MKPLQLTKETLIGKFILASHNSEGYNFIDMFDDIESAESKFAEIEKAHKAAGGSTCITGSIELIQLPEGILLDEDAEGYLDSHDEILLPSYSGFDKNYKVLFPMNDCVIRYCDVEDI